MVSFPYSNQLDTNRVRQLDEALGYWASFGDEARIRKLRTIHLDGVNRPFPTVPIPNIVPM